MEVDAVTPRLRPAEVPEGMNPAHSEAARSDPGAQRAFKLANSYASNPRGDACVGKRLDVYWDDDQTWYRGVVRAHDRGGTRTRCITRRMTSRRRCDSPRFASGGSPTGGTNRTNRAEPPEVFEPGLEHRGVKVDGSATVLFMRRPETVGKQQEQEEEEEEEEEEEDAAAPRPRAAFLGQVGG